MPPASSRRNGTRPPRTWAGIGQARPPSRLRRSDGAGARDSAGL